MAGYLMSLDEAKDHLNKDRLVVTDDDELLDMLEALTTVVEFYVGPVIPVQFVERYASGRVISLLHYPVTELTSVEPWLTSGTSYPVADLVVQKDIGVIERGNGLPFTGGPFEVTYKAGRDPVPENIKLGAKYILAHNWETQRGRTNTRLPGTPGGDETVVVKGRGYAVPNRAKETLNPHEQPPTGVMVG